MKKASLRTKITLWFSMALVLMAALTFIIVFSVSWSILQKSVRDGLIRTVEDNVDEVEFYASFGQLDRDGDADIYIRYKAGYLEVDDDFLDEVNGVYTALYREDGELLYGENPIGQFTAEVPCKDRQWQRVSANGVRWYVFDRKLEQAALNGLWLRGVVSEREGQAPLQDTARVSLILLPLMLLAAIGGGNIIAGRALRPVKRMSETVAQISGGDDLKKRIPVSGGGDELARLAVSFNEMMNRLDEAFEAEQQFASDASHELRTPMSVILAQCDYALEGERSPEEYRTALQLIRRQGGRMSRLIGDMLALLRMEHHTQGSPRERLNFSALAKSVSGDMALIGEKGIQLSYEGEEDIFVRGDAGLFTRLMGNLIGNAYRYGRENGHIWVQLKREGNQAVFSVADDGIGIAPEQREKIFRRFYQAAPERTGGGAGLGLAMVRQIARMYGGEILVESEVDKGSKFTLRLPLDSNIPLISP